MDSKHEQRTLNVALQVRHKDSSTISGLYCKMSFLTYQVLVSLVDKAKTLLKNYFYNLFIVATSKVLNYGKIFKI